MASEKRCEISDLIPGQCAHCLKHLPFWEVDE